MLEWFYNIINVGLDTDFEDVGLDTDFEDAGLDVDEEVWEITREDFEKYIKELDRLYYDSCIMRTLEPKESNSPQRSKSLSPNHRTRGFGDWALV